MKMAILSAAAYLAVLGGAADGCGGPKGTDPCLSAGCTVTTPLRSQVGDGIWVAGEDILVGDWTPPKGWRDKKACRWFVSPAEGKPEADLPSWDMHPANSVPLGRGMSLTTADCGQWKLREE